MVNQKEQFMIYVRTLMFFRTRLKDIDEDLRVYISSKDVERFFPFPKFDRKRELEGLIKAGELDITNGISSKGFPVFYYEALKPGAMDIRTIKPLPPSNDPLIIQMKKNLLSTTLIPGTPSTPYFSAFIRFREKYLDLFFTEDTFCGRIHTPVTSLPGAYRKNILIDGQETISFDVATMQPVLLGKILKDQIGPNEFSSWIDHGEDIYVMLQEMAGLKSRKEGKDRFFKILYSKPNDDLALLFGNAIWITWVNDFKTIVVPENPHTNEKPHSNLSWLLQTEEVKLMRQVWSRLVDLNIPFLTVHDEIIVRKADARQAKTIMHEVLSKAFVKYRINSSEEIHSTPDIVIPTQLMEQIVKHYYSFTLPYDINNPGDLESLVSGFIFETEIDVDVNTYRTAAQHYLRSRDPDEKLKRE